MLQPMKTGYQRKKQPAVVRQKLLDVAAQITNEQGMDALTLDAVAREAGVSKGGLLHHFAGRQALLHGLCDEMIERLDTQIDAAMADDPRAGGRFARAYLAVMSSTESAEDAHRAGALYVAMFADADLRKRWAGWLKDRLEQHKETDSSPEARIVLLAADGLWLADLVGAPQVRGGLSQEVTDTLVEMSRCS